MTVFKVVLIDIDGTLVDSNELHAQAWVDACVCHDRQTTFDKVRPLIGMGGDLLLQELLGLDPDSDDGKRLRATRARIFHEQYMPQVKPFPGARAFVERCRQAGLGRVAASSSSERDAEQLLRIAGVSDLVEDTTTASDAENSKPCPDIVLAAVEKSGVGAAHAVLVGDTPYDVQAANRAGVTTIGVRSGGWSDKALEGAVAVFDDVADLLRRWDDSPLGAKRSAQ